MIREHIEQVELIIPFTQHISVLQNFPAIGFLCLEEAVAARFAQAQIPVELIEEIIKVVGFHRFKLCFIIDPIIGNDRGRPEGINRFAVSKRGMNQVVCA
ncbi:hypothetical protein D3C75_1030490 [compost metagenome]